MLAISSDEAAVVELRAVREIDRIEELAAPVDVEAVVGAVAVETDAEIVDELRERQRDHDEIEPAGAQAQRADGEREQRRGGDRDRPLDEARADALLRQDADGIAADAEIDGVAEAHHAAVAQDQVEAGRRHRQDHDAREQRHQEGVAGERGIDRHQRQEHEQDGDHHIARREPGFHLQPAFICPPPGTGPAGAPPARSPSRGRSSSTTAPAPRSPRRARSSPCAGCRAGTRARWCRAGRREWRQ